MCPHPYLQASTPTRLYIYLVEVVVGRTVLLAAAKTLNNVHVLPPLLVTSAPKHGCSMMGWRSKAPALLSSQSTRHIRSH